MSKILYIGNYLDTSSWGRLCRDYITAMAQGGLDIVCRPYLHTIGAHKIELPQLIQALEDKDSYGAEICIQQVPIEDAVMDYRFKKNIFIFGSLKHHWKPSEIESLKRFRDCVVLYTNDNVKGAFAQIARENNIVLQPISYPAYLFEDLFNQEAKKLEYLSTPSYKFYTFGKISHRKNIRKLLQAFYLEFDKDENVDLVLKVTADIEPEEAGKIVSGAVEQVLNDLGKYPKLEDYRPPLLITGWSDDENLIQLHKSCNCFVDPSWAEHQEYKAIHARLAGNQTITKEIFENTGPERMILETQPLNLTPYTFDKFEIISDFDLVELMRLMRAAYTNHSWFKASSPYEPNFMKTVNSIL